MIRTVAGRVLTAQQAGPQSNIRQHEPWNWGETKRENKDCISYNQTCAQQLYIGGSVKSESDGYLDTEVQTFYACQHGVNHKEEALDHQKMLPAVSAQCTWYMQLNNVKLLAILPSPSVFQRIKGAVVSTADYLLHFCTPVSTDTKREAGSWERETRQLAVSRRNCKPFRYFTAYFPQSFLCHIL